MTLDECRAVLIPFALAVRADFDVPTQRAYFQVLKDVPIGLLQGAVRVAEQDASLRFFPGAPEWRGRCEMERRRLMALQPYEPCTACHRVGTVKTSAPGVLPPRYGPCVCKAQHRQRLERLGIPEQPLAQLPAARQLEGEEAPVVSVDELPPAISDRVRRLAERSRW